MSLKDLQILPYVLLSRLVSPDGIPGEKNISSQSNTTDRIRRQLKKKNDKRQELKESSAVPDWIDSINGSADNAFATKTIALRSLKFNNPETNSILLDSSDIAKHFVDCVQETDWLMDDVKLHLLMHLAALFTILISSDSIDEFKDDCMYILEDLGDDDKEYSYTFLLAYRKELFEILHDQEVNQQCMQQLVQFFGLILAQLRIENSARRLRMIRQVHTPSYVNEVLKNRIVLLLLLPNSWRFKSIFSSHYLVRGNRIDEGWMNISKHTIRADEWESLLRACRLPRLDKVDKVLGSGGVHREFSGIIWGGIGKEGWKKMGNKKPDLILYQMFTFLMPNWEELWVSLNLERSYELNKRLLCIKHENWVPSVEDLLILLFNHNAQ